MLCKLEIYNNCKSYEKSLFTMEMNCGLRIADILALNIEDVRSKGVKMTSN